MWRGNLCWLRGCEWEKGEEEDEIEGGYEEEAHSEAKKKEQVVEDEVEGQGRVEEGRDEDDGCILCISPRAKVHNIYAYYTLIPI